ncbi:MAG: hypothetical protein ABF289_12070 [Clostridiales bacterium]
MVLILTISILIASLISVYVVKYIKIDKESQKIIKTFELEKIDIFRDNYVQVKNNLQ